MTNEVIKEAISLTKGKWWKFFGVYLLSMVICFVCGGMIGGILSALIKHEIAGMITSGICGGLFGSIIGYGIAKYFFDARNNEEKLVTIFYGFTNFVGYLKYLVSSIVLFLAFYIAYIIIFLIAGLIGGIFGVLVGGMGVTIVISIILGLIGFVFGVIIALLYTFYIYENYEGKGIISSLKESRKLVSGRKWFVFWTPIKACLIPIIMYLVGIIAEACCFGYLGINLVSQAASNPNMGGEQFISLLLSSVPAILVGLVSGLLIFAGWVWLLILFPRLLMIAPVMYDKLKEEKGITKVEEVQEVQE